MSLHSRPEYEHCLFPHFSHPSPCPSCCWLGGVKLTGTTEGQTDQMETLTISQPLVNVSLSSKVNWPNIPVALKKTGKAISLSEACQGEGRKKARLKANQYLAWLAGMSVLLIVKSGGSRDHSAGEEPSGVHWVKCQSSPLVHSLLYWQKAKSIDLLI